MKGLPTPNTSILECPECKKGLLNIGSEVKRVHPIAQFITRYKYAIVLTWAVFISAFVFYFSAGRDRGMGLGWAALLTFPSIIMYFLLRAFPLYRLTDCPYCGFHEKQRLGHSLSE